jgi:origin recognition complex subunit 2
VPIVQIFCTLAEALLGDMLHDDDEITGISYEHLFRLCRERFLASSNAALQQHLTEFKDHDLLKTKKGHDGVSLLYIPVAPSELQQLCNSLKEQLEAS